MQDLWDGHHKVGELPIGHAVIVTIHWSSPGTNLTRLSVRTCEKNSGEFTVVTYLVKNAKWGVRGVKAHQSGEAKRGKRVWQWREKVKKSSDYVQEMSGRVSIVHVFKWSSPATNLSRVSQRIRSLALAHLFHFFVRFALDHCPYPLHNFHIYVAWLLSGHGRMWWSEGMHIGGHVASRLAIIRDMALRCVVLRT